MSSGRYLFLSATSRTPSGGTAVLYHAIDVLRRAGYDALALHDERTGDYPLSPFSPPRAYTYAMQRVRMRRRGLIGGFRIASMVAADTVSGGRNPRLRMAPHDTLVVAEYQIDIAAEAFPDQRKLVFVQNPFSYRDALARTIARGHDPSRGVVATLAASRICMEFAEIFGAGPAIHVPVAPEFARYAFRADKRRLIAIMPRKCPADARVLTEALHRRGRIADFRLVEIHGVGQSEVARLMGESLIFVSLMRSEGLGFPAMEAMASGCITIGYTGVGAREFFDDESGIVLPDGDVAALVATIESTVAEYDDDPTRLDALRRTAAARVTTEYSTARFETALVEAWHRLEGPPASSDGGGGRVPSSRRGDARASLAQM